MPKQPLALNLARIVERLTTDPRGWRVDELRAELGIADRTYRKYKALLIAQFPPWRQEGRTRLEEVEEADGRWLRVRPSGEEDPALEALIERLTAFHLARQLFAIIGEPGLERPVRHALDELIAEHRPRRFATLAQLEGRMGQILFVAPDAPKDYAAQTAIVQELLRALVYARRVRMTYGSASLEPKTHEVEPLTLAMYRGGLHLFARFPGHQRVYNFVIDRISNVERLLGPGGSFAYPGPDEWSPGRHTRNAFGIFVRDGDHAYEVDLVFAPVRWLQLYLRERTWHPSQQFKAMKGGRLRLSFEVGSLEEVIPWVRQFGQDVVVRKPAELRKALRPVGPRSKSRKGS